MRSAAWRNSSKSFHQKKKEAKQRFLLWLLFLLWISEARSRQVSLRERSECSGRQVRFISRSFLMNAAKCSAESEGHESDRSATSAAVQQPGAVKLQFRKSGSAHLWCHLAEIVGEPTGLLLQTKTSPWTLTKTPSASTLGGPPASAEAWAPARCAPTPSRLSWAPCCGRGPCRVTEACSSSSTWTWRSS